MTIRQLDRYTYRTARHHGLTIQQAEDIRKKIRTTLIARERAFLDPHPPFVHLRSTDVFIQSTLRQEINQHLSAR